jgi:hypothetical protein
MDFIRLDWVTSFYIVEQKDCTHELEKAYLIIEQKDKIIEHKDKEITYLQEIIELLKKESAS